MPKLHPDETIIDRFDHHWIRFVVPTLTYLLVVGILAIIGYFAVTEGGNAAGLILVILGTGFLCATHAFFRFLFSEALEVTYITQYRLVHFEQRIFVKDDILQVPFDTVKNVVGKKHGILANLLDYGDLTFTTTGTTIHTIPEPDRIAELIQELTGRLTSAPIPPTP